MTSATLFVCCMVALAAAAPGLRYDPEDAETHFEVFITTYNKAYSSENEKRMRFEIFKQNLELYNQKNKMEEDAVFGIDRFSDLTKEEFLSMYTGYRNSRGSSPCPKASISPASFGAAPAAFDWRDKNKVTRVKDQGQCGSCWAFSSTGNIESQYAIVHNKLVEVSESQMVDCDDDSLGCNGGLMSEAIEYAKEVGGMMSEADYPYVPKDGDCQFNKDKVVVKVTGCNKFTVASEDELKETMFQTGPLAIGVDADSFFGYKSGILNVCKADYLDHGVLLVGYGTENSTAFWTIKNSWGHSWGEAGYIRIKRNVNACNIMDKDNDISSAVVA